MLIFFVLITFKVVLFLIVISLIFIPLISSFCQLQKLYLLLSMLGHYLLVNYFYSASMPVWLSYFVLVLIQCCFSSMQVVMWLQVTYFSSMKVGSNLLQYYLLVNHFFSSMAGWSFTVLETDWLVMNLFQRYCFVLYLPSFAFSICFIKTLDVLIL